MSPLSRKVSVAVLKVAGTNCDQETMHAFKLAGAYPRLISLRELLSGREKLDPYAILMIPGGFSYGDDIAAGKILASHLKHKLADPLRRFVEQDRLVIGVCNGFQVLIKSGLLPGLDGAADKAQYATLSFNDSGRFEDRWVWLKTNTRSRCVFARALPPRFYLPVAHGEGKFMVRDKKILKELVDNGQIVFQYTDESGKAAPYPANPNGSVLGVAGICNKKGNVIGLMPHPERFWDSCNHPRWTQVGRQGRSGEGGGMAFYRAAVQYAAKLNLK